MLENVNLLAVLAAAIASMIVGYLWYSPLLFGKPWMELMGFSKKQNKELEKKAPLAMAMGFLLALVQALILALFIAQLGVTTYTGGLMVGGMVWLGFVTITQFTDVLYANKSMQLYSLNTGYQLTSLLVMGGILGVWG